MLPEGTMERDDASITDDPSISLEGTTSYVPQPETTKEHSLLQGVTGIHAARSGRLPKSSVGKDKAAASKNTRQAYPALKLSGNIISATICLPYNFEHGPSGWVRERSS